MSELANVAADVVVRADVVDDENVGLESEQYAQAESCPGLPYPRMDLPNPKALMKMRSTHRPRYRKDRLESGSALLPRQRRRLPLEPLGKGDPHYVRGRRLFVTRGRRREA